MALHEALRFVETKFVLVVQHDWAFLRSFPIESVLRVMQTHPEVKYVGLPSSSSLSYVETASVRDPELRSSMVSLEEKYGMPLYPLLFWFDKTHICRTDHYRAFVFGRHPRRHEEASPEEPGAPIDSSEGGDGEAGRAPSGIQFRRGEFIEDTLGHRQLADIRAHGFSAHAKYGTFLYDDGAGEVISHLDGRRFLTPSQRERQGMPRNVVRSAPAYVREALRVKSGGLADGSPRA